MKTRWNPLDPEHPLAHVFGYLSKHHHIGLGSLTKVSAASSGVVELTMLLPHPLPQEDPEHTTCGTQVDTDPTRTCWAAGDSGHDDQMCTDVIVDQAIESALRFAPAHVANNARFAIGVLITEARFTGKPATPKTDTGDLPAAGPSKD